MQQQGDKCRICLDNFTNPLDVALTNDIMADISNNADVPMGMDALLNSSSFNYNNNESKIPLDELVIGTDNSKYFLLFVKQYSDTNTFNGCNGEWITEIGCNSSENYFCRSVFVSRLYIDFSKQESLVQWLECESVKRGTSNSYRQKLD